MILPMPLAASKLPLEIAGLLAQVRFLNENGRPTAGLIIFLLVIVAAIALGLWKDLPRFSFARIRAVARVGFIESIRRRVLWVTPLAMLAVILVAQFQKPIDELDAIRQTTKFCLFATGMLVTLTAILLACTNLPKEIDNRVIFTIVTKPTTRFEIVLGKVMGFAYVSGTILLIMGAFTFGYLHLRAWTMQRDVQKRLDTPNGVEVALRPTLEHYVDAGLLNAKEYFRPLDLNFYTSVPDNSNTGVRWISGASEQSVAVPFEIPLDKLPGSAEDAAGLPPLRVIAKVQVRKSAGGAPATNDNDSPTPATSPAASTRPASTAPEGFAVRVPYLPGKEPAPGEENADPSAPPAAPTTPMVAIDVTDRGFYNLIESPQINEGKGVSVDVGPDQTVDVLIPASALVNLRTQSVNGGPAQFHVGFRGLVPGFDYGIDDDAFRVGYAMPAGAPQPFAEEYKALKPPASTDHLPVTFRGRMGTHGQQLRGDAPGSAPVAVYRFRRQPVATANAAGQVPLEVRTFIERSGVDEDNESLLDLLVSVRNVATGQTTAPVTVHPENARTSYANLPASALAGGNFDLLMQVNTPGAWISLNDVNVGLVAADRSFGLNLAKSLFILWLLAILVVTIAIFCSTFLSWPIAVVLTVLILLGRWGVMQLGDSLTPGIGRQVVTDFGVKDAAGSMVVSNTVERLSAVLRTVSTVLPDIDSFAVTDHIERGVWIPIGTLLDALYVLFLFGVPLVLMAYAIFRHKEVAP